MSEREDIRDISEHLDQGDVPECPLCDDVIWEDQPTCTVRAHGAIALVHRECFITDIASGDQS